MVHARTKARRTHHRSRCRPIGYAFVAQGSLCRNGSALTVTTDSAIGLAVPVSNPNPATCAACIRAASSMAIPDCRPCPTGYPDGSISLGSNGELLPTRARLKQMLALRSFLGRCNDAR